MTETIGIEISARQLTDSAFQSVVRNIEQMNRAAQQSATGIGQLGAAANTAATFFKGAGIGAAVAFAYDQLSKFHGEVKQSLAAIQEQADALQISTTAYQAYSYAADQVGVKQEALNSVLGRFGQRVGEAMGGNRAAIDGFEKLGVKILDANGRLRDQSSIVTDAARAIMDLGSASERTAAAKDVFGLASGKVLALLPQLARGMDDLASSADKASVMIDQKIIAQASRLQNQGSQTALVIRRFYAEIGMPIETKYLEVVAGVVGRITTGYLEANDALMKFIANAGSQALDKDIAALERKIANAQDTLKNPGLLDRMLKSDSGDKSIQREIDGYRKELDAKLAARKEIDDKYRTYTQHRTGADTGSPAGVVDWVPDTGQGGRNPTPVAKGGGGGDSRDRIQEAINRLKGEAVAARDALAALQAGAATPLKDLEQQVALQKKIADEVAKLGRYDPKDPRVAQIRELVIAREQAEDARKKFAAAERDADQIERQQGDGTIYLRDEMQRLNEALDTGRLSYEAYAVAVRQAREKAEDMRLSLVGQQQGFDGLVAGMQYAANQWERNNRAYQRGQQLFNSTVNLMGQGLSDFVNKGEADFGRLGASFVNMLANMALQSAASGLFSAAGGALGGLFGGLFGDGVTAASPAATMQAYNSLSPALALPGFASGGEPPIGMPSIVGERGPELFVPKQPGTILNAAQTAAIGGGGSGPVAVYQTNHFGSDVSRAEMERWASVVEQRARGGAMAGVIDNRRRGGTMKAAFA